VATSSGSDLETTYGRLLKEAFPGSCLLRARRLAGGVSAEVVAVEIMGPDDVCPQTVVVRRHGAADVRRDPEVAAHEFRLLRILHDAGLPVPRPIYLGTPGGAFATPYIVTEFLAGTSDEMPDDPEDLSRQLAALLAAIHQVQASELTFLSTQDARLQRLVTQPPGRSALGDLEEGARAVVLATLCPARRSDEADGMTGTGAPPMALLHGDFWPGNVLWLNGRISGVIDWEDAQLGSPLWDLANARLELLWAKGAGAAAAFTHAYAQITGCDTADLAAWDLCAALEAAHKMGNWGLLPPKVAAMTGDIITFVQQALDRL